jgi:hypothetical protein
MSKYTFIDGYGDERPMPPEHDNDEAQYQRGFTGGSWPTDDPIITTEVERISHAHDMKCEAFKRGWEAGTLHMANAEREAARRFGEYEH